MDAFRRFMTGRYGNDHMNMALLIAGLVLSLILNFIPVPWIGWIALLPLGWAIYRMLSRNVVRRRIENQKWLSFWYPISNRIRRYINHLKDGRTHRFYHCPNCKQQLRVPKGKGKINITCPKCKTSFTKKT